MNASVPCNTSLFVMRLLWEADTTTDDVSMASTYAWFFSPPEGGHYTGSHGGITAGAFEWLPDRRRPAWPPNVAGHEPDTAGGALSDGQPASRSAPTRSPFAASSCRPA